MLRAVYGCGREGKGGGVLRGMGVEEGKGGGGGTGVGQWRLGHYRHPVREHVDVRWRHLRGRIAVASCRAARRRGGACAHPPGARSTAAPAERVWGSGGWRGGGRLGGREAASEQPIPSQARSSRYVGSRFARSRLVVGHVRAAGGRGASHCERQREEHEGAVAGEGGLAEQRIRDQSQSAQDLPYVQGG